MMLMKMTKMTKTRMIMEHLAARRVWVSIMEVCNSMEVYKSF